MLGQRLRDPVGRTAATEAKPRTPMAKTLIIVGGSFARIIAAWGLRHLLDAQHRILLIWLNRQAIEGHSGESMWFARYLEHPRDRPAVRPLKAPPLRSWSRLP